LVSRKGLHRMASARRKVHLPAGRHVYELQATTSQRSEVIAVHAVPDGGTVCAAIKLQTEMNRAI
jgi:hypothetical protein